MQASVVLVYNRIKDALIGILQAIGLFQCAGVESILICIRQKYTQKIPPKSCIAR